MDTLNRILIKELEVLELGSKIQSQVQSEVGKNQREYFLREQMKAIQKELGEGDDQTKEIDELAREDRSRRDAGARSARRRSASSIGLRRCRSPRRNTPCRGPISTGWSRCRGRSAPTKSSTCRRRKQMLDADHSGLEKAKDRILEYLAVRKLNPDVKGPDSLLRRPSRRRQDVAGASRSRSRSAASSSACRSAACATKPRFAGIAAPTSARCPARSSRGCAAPSRRTRCSSWTRSTSSGPISAATRLRAARGARPGAEQHLPRPLPRRAVRPVGGAVHHHGQRARPGSAGAARPHGGARDPRLHRGREAEDRARAPGREAGQRTTV